MGAIAASKVLLLNSNAFPCLSKSFRRHHHHHRFVCFLQSRGNQQLKLVTSEETHIVKPVLKPLTPTPKPKRRVVLQVLFLTALAGVMWIELVIIPKKYKMINESIISSTLDVNSIVSRSSIEDINYAYTPGEWQLWPCVMILLSMKLICIHEDIYLRNRKKNVALRVLGVIFICVFVGCWLRLVSLANVRDTLLTTRGDGPWHLTQVVGIILLNIGFIGACSPESIHQQENRINTPICVGSGTQVGDLKSRKRSRRPRKKSKEKRNNSAEQRSWSRKEVEEATKKSSGRGTIVLNKDLGKTTPVDRSTSVWLEADP